MNSPARHPANGGEELWQRRSLHEPGPTESSSVSSTYPMVISPRCEVYSTPNERPPEDDMHSYALQMQSLEESHNGPTPWPTWDQAIVLSNRGPISQERGADGSIRSRRSSGGLVTALEPLVHACSATWGWSTTIWWRDALT